MLKENIKTLRKQKGLSQEELAVKLNVVRQTVSKWEQGLSVPDAEMLISLSEVFETPVSTLLGENVPQSEPDSLKEISEKLEVINQQLAERQEQRRKTRQIVLIAITVCIIILGCLAAAMGNTYLEWDYSNPEMSVAGVIIHAFVWVFVRIAPLVMIGTILAACLTRKKQ